MKHTLVVFLILFSSLMGNAQQDPLFSQYMFNGLAVNPAFAGSKEQISSALLYRRQWLGVGMAPVVQSFNIHAPFQYQRIGLGLQAVNESFSIQDRLSVCASYSYKINFARGVMSFGITGGFIQSSVKYSELNVTEDEKPFLKNNTSIIMPDVGAGLYYQDNAFYIGISSLHLISSSIQYNNHSLDINAVKRHFYLLSGYRWQISQKIQILPSVLFKYVSGKYYQADFTTHIKYDDMVWAGVSFRTENTFAIQAGFKISDLLMLTRQSIKIGYAYDWSNNSLNLVSRGSHEIMLILDLSIYKKPSKIRKEKINISPVFF